MGVGDVFQCGSPGGTSIQSIYVGDDHPHGPVPGSFSSQNGHKDSRGITLEASV